jgi:hypothetical protein
LIFQIHISWHFPGLGIALPCDVQQTICHVDQTIPDPNFDVFFVDMKVKKSGITWRDFVDLKKLKAAVEVLKNKKNHHYKNVCVPDDLLMNKKYEDAVTMIVEDENNRDEQSLCCSLSKKSFLFLQIMRTL